MTDEEIVSLCRLLAKCQPGELPIEIFNEIARLTVSLAIEFIPLRYNGQQIEVLLIPRPTGDPIWPGMVHTPGTILRPTDTSFEDAFNRLFNDELGIADKPNLLFNGFNLGTGLRGSTLSLEYIINLNQPPRNGTYYPYSNLPNNFIAEQKGLVDRAVKRFQTLS
jgi:hypothetical protein